MAATAAATSLGKTFSVLNAEETGTTRFSRPSNLHCQRYLKAHPNNNKSYFKQETNTNKKMQMVIAPRSCLISNNNLGPKSRTTFINSSTSTSSSPSSLYMDTFFRTELEISNRRLENQQQQQQQQQNSKRKHKVGGAGKEQQSAISAEKLDEWIRHSVSEIVSNIRDAPLLVQVFSNNKEGSSSSSSSSFERRKAEPESWAGIKKSWDEGSPVPDGIILVEQIKTEDENANTSSTKTWGVVIQGRGCDSASSCYILQTCRVGSALGFCTHFCLVRAKCFGEIADLQLKNSWLLN